ncbi:hypothetical protein [Streptomyces sp900116325]|uniref:Uncharacterized protein n=1 Tax=Streptomyces sp. 900116325 TaxID=3154295 RepID=A0ABV2U5U8_9ACTN
MTSRSAPPADLDALRTGDLVNRLKVGIEYQGCRVPPGRARGTVSDHPQIEDAAVIGVLDAEGEGDGRSLRPPAAGPRIGEAAGMESSPTCVSPYENLCRVEFVAAVPRVGLAQHPAQGPAGNRGLTGVGPATYSAE